MNKNKLISILSIQTESYNQFRMFAYIIRELNRLNINYYTYNGCIYAHKGKADAYPCIVSHMDTVHEIVENLTPIEINGNITGINSVTMEQAGIGGDDKVGIYIALECLDKFDNMKAVFFRDEEVGCVGSYSPDINFFADCSFILQCDRRGNSDCIINASGTELSSKNFQADVLPFLQTYGYKFNNGAMTDVMALKQCGINCSVANISCGYYNPHTAQEYVNIEDVENTLNLVCDLFTYLGQTKYPHKHKKKETYKFSSYQSKLKWDDEIISFDQPKQKYLSNVCEFCFKNSHKVEYITQYDMELCDDCINDYVYTWRK